MQCGKDGHIDYISSTSENELLKVLSDVIDGSITQKMHESPVVTVLTDESTDIVVHHKLAINVRVVDPVTLTPSTFFLSDVRLHAATGKAIFDSIKSELDKRRIPITKVFGLGTDGARVMTGEKNGLTGHFLRVNPHLKNTHCSAHRIALVSEQAAENVPAVRDFRKTLESIYYYFYKSPARCDQLESIQKVLEDPVLRIREVHSVRWLSFFMALETVYRTTDSLITFFQSRRASDAKAVGLKKKNGQELFIRIMYGMMDWLQPIMTPSQFFQRKDVDVSVVKTNVNSCLRDLESMKDSDRCAGYYRQLEVELVDGVFKGQHLAARNASHFESVKSRFLQAMIDNVRSRFPETKMLTKLCVLRKKPL